VTTRKRKPTALERERYELLKGMLEDRRREIHEKLRSLREAIPAASHDVRDAEEQSVDEFVQEVDLALMQMKSETLKKIDAAMAKNPKLTTAQTAEVKKYRADGEALHKAGKHQESVDTLARAMKILNIK